MKEEKNPVLFFRIATAYHLTQLTQCLTLSPRGRGSRKVCLCVPFSPFGGGLPWEVVPSARPAVGHAESSLPALTLKYL